MWGIVERPGGQMSRVAKFLKSPLVIVIAVAAVATAWATRDQWTWLLEDGGVNTVGAVAPALDDLDGNSERLYRVSSNAESSVTYSVEETLAGKSQAAQGTTPGVAGDIAVNVDDPSLSRLGQIVINVELFESDSALRDKRIRGDFLDSSEYPMATFEADAIEGLPDSLDGDTTADLQISGDLTVKEVTAPVTFEGTATLTEDLLTANMTGTVLMSDYGIGPINLVGLVRTGDEVELTLDLVAERTEIDEPAPSGAVLLLPESDIPEGEFAESVQPIIEARCASCHVDDGAGAHTVELATAGDVAEIADEIALVTGAGYMPPWPASDVGLTMKHDFSIDDDEVDTIAEWASAGGGLDVPADTPIEADTLTYDPIEEDIVTMPAESYTGSLDRPDDYRCVISEVPDPEGDGTWIHGFSFEPDETEVVHHSIITAIAPESRAAIEELDAADEGSGFTCFGQVGAMGGVKSTGLGGWTPGRQPTTLPEGTGIYLEPGSFIVNQIHYHYDHEELPDRSAIVLDAFSPEEVSAFEDAGTPLRNLDTRVFINPAEGPCTPEESGPLCDRDAVLDDIEAKYGTLARFLPDVFVRGCGGTVDDYDDLDGTLFSSECDHQARLDGTLFSVLPHMHELGSSYRMTLNPDTPDEVVIVDIPRWNFDWQLLYEPVEEIRIERGDTIRVECVWDRALMTDEEPRYVTWSDGTVDEMCFSPVTVIPDRAPND